MTERTGTPSRSSVGCPTSHTDSINTHSSITPRVPQRDTHRESISVDTQRESVGRESRECPHRNKEESPPSEDSVDRETSEASNDSTSEVSVDSNSSDDRGGHTVDSVESNSDIDTEDQLKVSVDSGQCNKHSVGSIEDSVGGPPGDSHPRRSSEVSVDSDSTDTTEGQLTVSVESNSVVDPEDQCVVRVDSGPTTESVDSLPTMDSVDSHLRVNSVDSQPGETPESLRVIPAWDSQASLQASPKGHSVVTAQHRGQPSTANSTAQRQHSISPVSAP